jgi:hypothetical protein
MLNEKITVAKKLSYSKRRWKKVQYTTSLSNLLTKKSVAYKRRTILQLVYTAGLKMPFRLLQQLLLLLLYLYISIFST